MRFPIYLSDGKPLCSVTEFQTKTIREVAGKLKTGEYRLVSNNCLCLNANPAKDVVIAEKDRYGFPVPSILCSKCGLIRSGLVFDEISNREFYKNEYRSIYIGAKIPPESFFKDQALRGREFFNLWKSVLPEARISNIFEVGCGAGGILLPFHESGIKCSGSDYDEHYLDYGKLKGLALYSGDYSKHVADDSVDLIILSHVMEHFLDPVAEMQNLIMKIRPAGYLLVEVPGIYCIDSMYYDPILYFQNAHVFNYYCYYLKIFFAQLGLKVIFGNERCTFILKKPRDWQVHAIDSVYDPALSGYFEKIREYIVITHWKYVLKLNPYQWREKIVRILGLLGLKGPMKEIRNIIRNRSKLNLRIGISKLPQRGTKFTK